MNFQEILGVNKAGWNNIADDWFGTTSLPTYAPLMPDETELGIFKNVEGKKVLDLGCGSGHSLGYLGKNGASELWGLDLSEAQICNAESYLASLGHKSNLFVSPMENNPGIPEEYFDYVYSIYAFGWTHDLELSIKRVSRYLKKDGYFIFSWDHPLTPCLNYENNNLAITSSYHDESIMDLVKGENKMHIRKWTYSSYINTLATQGFIVERLIEEVRDDVFDDSEDFRKYYSKSRARLMPLSFIMVARKL